MARKLTKKERADIEEDAEEMQEQGIDL